MIAFSSVSMANTIADEELVFEKENDVVAQTTPEQCNALKYQYYNHLISQGATHEVASGQSYGIYFRCMGEAIQD